ncbi:MAG TPA: hypothetical protein VFQ67_03860 [Allosphingosinicella sp.]|jgi:uncharacterized lipoprotein YajG|nr:hypothetical protein [Allosphingosinicella sp.]
MMKSRTALAAAPLAALLALAGCQNETIDGNADPQANAANATATPVEAPPMIQASRTYRCKDNSLLYADFYTNDTVQVRSAKDKPPTVLTAAAAGQPYTAEGYSLSANSEQISYTAPGKGAQSCKA